MKRQSIIVLILLQVSISAFSQEFLWKAGVNSFFNNTEFDGSAVAKSQTMAGTHFVPQIGLSFEGKHRIFVGVDVMHEFGSDKTIGYHDPIAYYEYDGKPFRFYMGAFPRKPLLENYPRMFFQDSINNYRPVMTGFFWELYNKDDYFNIWLDWTSRQTNTNREAFFMGWSGKYNHDIFYGQHFGYMYHFATTANPDIPEQYVQDNGLVLTSLGVDFSKKTGWEKLEINAGWALGLEQDRGTDAGWNLRQGFLSEIKAEYKGLGLFNTFYRGAGQQTSYNRFGNMLYWGSAFYRLKQYNRLDSYIRFIENSVVNVKFTYSLHFAEGNMFHEQALYATFNLDNLKKKPQKPYEYLWNNWLSSLRD